MRQSKLFVKTLKNLPKDEISESARLLLRAGFADKLMAGVYTLLPLGFKVFKKIEQIIRSEMEMIGGQEIFMPALQPKENWEKTGRWQNLDILFRLLAGEGREVALGPTHEEIVTPLVSRFVKSYRDLPLAVFHIQNKFRNEKRAKSGLLRGREFIMKDLYSFHADQADLDDYYEKAKQAYLRIFARCGLGDYTYVTYASGGSFSKYSHEFQALSVAGEDLIYLCPDCRLAVNKEIIEDVNHSCPQCGRGDLSEQKAIEVGNIFQLGTKFSVPFGLSFLNDQGESRPVLMGCYGIGLQRLLATVIEIHHDEQGMLWPKTIAPALVHLVGLNLENKAVMESADNLYQRLLDGGIEVLFDDRIGPSAGEKFAEADLFGLPYRVVISSRTVAEGKLEIKERAGKKVDFLATDDLLAFLRGQS